MKKRILIGAMTCWMALSAQAQFQYDRALPMPTRDLYDTGVMNMRVMGTVLGVMGTVLVIISRPNNLAA